jgi:nucleotide-binding universal stress UspA family protein
MAGRYEHIVCFVDDSEASRLALGHARRLMGQLGAGRLSIVHVHPPPEYVGGYSPPEPTTPPEAPAWLEALATDAPGAEIRFVDGSNRYPPAEGVGWALEEGADLIVAGTHRGLYRRLMLGGFAAYLAYHAPCPVTLVPPPIGPDRRTR